VTGSVLDPWSFVMGPTEGQGSTSQDGRTARTRDSGLGARDSGLGITMRKRK
jgi:hypothetical protein